MQFLSFRFTILLIFFSTILNAQYDTEHWFPALFSYQSGTAGTGKLHLSTGENAPFEISIYKQETLVRTVTISKGNPSVINMTGNLELMTVDESEFLTPLNKGLFLKADKRFFANIRISNSGGAEMINSKGAAALGREFMNAHMPITIPHPSTAFMTSVIATENNTKVTISGFDLDLDLSPNVDFNGEMTFTLNKGQSFGFAGSSVIEANREGFIGAKIIADKDIAVVNGAFNGQYFPEASIESLDTGQIMMDQSVPYSRLGESFILLRGFDYLSTGERAFVMATENGTDVYLNDETTPFVTLNSGEYAVIPSSKYKLQRTGMYSMYIRTTKKVYTYQIATGRTPVAPAFRVGTFILIPPVNCYLPETIDQISFIGSPDRNTKLNILTLKEANVRVNGVLLGPDYGPEEVVGNNEWANFVYFPRDEHITITSDKSVAMGMVSKSNFGGYFAGFSSFPAISKSGDCVSGILLSVDNTYDLYQWFKNGEILTGENGFSINPELYGSGTYTVEVSKASCDPLLTAGYVYSRCLEGIVTEENIGSCQSFVITPEFQGNTEPVDLSKTEITYEPLNGTVTINGNGEIIYTPNPTITTDYIDDFTYRIYGFGSDPLIQTFSVKLYVDVLNIPTPLEHKVCFEDLNNLEFDLNEIDLGTAEGNTVEFFENCSNGNCSNPIINAANYPNQGRIYAQVTSPFGCVQIVEIILVALEGLDSENLDIDICLNPDETEKTINLNDYIVEANPHFYNSKEDAENQQNEISSSQTIPANAKYYVRLQKGDCIQINTLNFSILQNPSVTINQQSGIITVNTSGGTPPFLYSIDGGDYSSNNIFTNVSSGLHIIRVKAGQTCEPQQFEVMYNGLPNVITPNGDQVNDQLDFSEFSEKQDLKINIFNRSGISVYSNSISKEFMWDGKTNGKPLPTGSYWYSIEWAENENPYQLNGWILLKNR